MFSAAGRWGQKPGMALAIFNQDGQTTQDLEEQEAPTEGHVLTTETRSSLGKHWVRSASVRPPPAHLREV